MTTPHDLSSQQPSRAARILVWPTIVACAVPVFLTLLCATPAWLIILWLFWMPGALVPIVWATSAVWASVLTFRALRQRLFLRGLSALVLPLTVTVCLVNFHAFTDLLIEGGDRLHFFVMRDRYAAEIASQPPTDHPRLMSWNWGGFVQSKGVVYDESDEIAAPHQSQAWRSRAEKTDLACDFMGYTPLGGHFYLVGFGC
jgi:hypothetical protein